MAKHKRAYNVEFNGCEWVIEDRFGNRVNDVNYDSGFDAVKDAIAFEQQDEALDHFYEKRAA